MRVRRRNRSRHTAKKDRKRITTIRSHRSKHSACYSSSSEEESSWHERRSRSFSDDDESSVSSECSSYSDHRYSKRSPAYSSRRKTRRNRRRKQDHYESSSSSSSESSCSESSVSSQSASSHDSESCASSSCASSIRMVDTAVNSESKLEDVGQVVQALDVFDGFDVNSLESLEKEEPEGFVKRAKLFLCGGPGSFEGSYGGLRDDEILIASSTMSSHDSVDMPLEPEVRCDTENSLEDVEQTETETPREGLVELSDNDTLDEHKQMEEVEEAAPQSDDVESVATNQTEDAPGFAKYFCCAAGTEVLEEDEESEKVIVWERSMDSEDDSETVVLERAKAVLDSLKKNDFIYVLGDNVIVSSIAEVEMGDGDTAFLVFLEVTSWAISETGVETARNASKKKGAGLLTVAVVDDVRGIVSHRPRLALDKKAYKNLEDLAKLSEASLCLDEEGPMKTKKPNKRLLDGSDSESEESSPPPQQENRHLRAQGETSINGVKYMFCIRALDMIPARQEEAQNQKRGTTSLPFDEQSFTIVVSHDDETEEVCPPKVVKLEGHLKSINDNAVSACIQQELTARRHESKVSTKEDDPKKVDVQQELTARRHKVATKVDDPKKGRSKPSKQIPEAKSSFAAPSESSPKMEKQSEATIPAHKAREGGSAKDEKPCRKGDVARAEPSGISCSYSSRSENLHGTNYVQSLSMSDDSVGVDNYLSFLDKKSQSKDQGETQECPRLEDRQPVEKPRAPVESVPPGSATADPSDDTLSFDEGKIYEDGRDADQVPTHIAQVAAPPEGKRPIQFNDTALLEEETMEEESPMSYASRRRRARLFLADRPLWNTPTVTKAERASSRGRGAQRKVMKARLERKNTPTEKSAPLPIKTDPRGQGQDHELSSSSDEFFDAVSRNSDASLD